MFQITVCVERLLFLLSLQLCWSELKHYFLGRRSWTKAAGIILMLIFMGGMGGIVLFTSSESLGLGIAESSPVDFRLIGTEMLTYYSALVIGLTLAGSIIGALALARRRTLTRKMNELVEYIAVSLILVAVGIYGIVVKRNAIRMIFSIEIIANAVI